MVGIHIYGSQGKRTLNCWFLIWSKVLFRDGFRTLADVWFGQRFYFTMGSASVVAPAAEGSGCRTLLVCCSFRLSLVFLHVVLLCLSPRRFNPFAINDCTIACLIEWPFTSSVSILLDFVGQLDSPRPLTRDSVVFSRERGLWKMSVISTIA